MKKSDVEAARPSRIREADTSLTRKECFLHEGGYVFDLRSFKVFAFFAVELFEHICVNTEEAEAIYPIRSSLKAHAVITVAGKEHFHSLVNSRLEFLESFGEHKHYRSCNRSSANARPVVRHTLKDEFRGSRHRVDYSSFDLFSDSHLYKVIESVL